MFEIHIFLDQSRQLFVVKAFRILSSMAALIIKLTFNFVFFLCPFLFPSSFNLTPNETTSLSK